MLSKSSKWELAFVHYIAKFTISRFVISRFECTFKFCAVHVALCALEPHSTDSLGTQHYAKFESNTKGMTLETNAICTTSDIQAHIYK